jgi:hypothetical protein
VNTPDLIVAYTIRDLTTLACPLCEFTIDVPPVPVSNQLGATFGMSGDTLARMHAEQVASRVSHEMQGHLEKHSVLDWLAAVVPDGVASMTPLSSRRRADAGTPPASAGPSTRASETAAGQGTPS